MGLGVGDVVDLVGHVEPAGLLGHCDVLVQLSVWENCSYSILDALSHGVGVVATPVGGNPEVLPATALRRHDDHAGIAAEVARQGSDPTARPVLPLDWPDRTAMCAALAEVYSQVARP